MPFRIKVSLAALVFVLTLLLVGPLVIPIPPLTDTVPAAQLTDPDSQFVEVDGVNVHYKTSSLAPPQGAPTFVLLHGFGSSTYTWHKVMDEFGALGRTVAFDRPAFGLTERPLPKTWRENPYTPQAQAELTLSFMDALDIDEAVLVGNSAGATVAAKAALARPERVTGLVIVDGDIYDESSRSTLSRLLLRTPQIDRLGPLLTRQLAGEPGTDFLRSAWSDPAKLDEATVAAYRKPLQTEDWDRALWEYTKASRPPGLESELNRLTLPVLVVTGADDKLVAPSLSERLAGELPSADLALLDACGHTPQEECPEPFMTAVTSWLEQKAFAAANR